ncbi:O-antigen ligase family protein [Roseiconus lacunae]|uniref:O-antigen ligase family protein n=1 Tax=Roseiconus lacunae TaxID=2605694 RepID=UPI003085ABB6|nr:O-antigen ligase family protein [Stieleria sp. HD01]
MTPVSRSTRLAHQMQWLVAVILTVLPILVAMDYGGVLAWTQSVAASAITVAVVIALVANRVDRSDPIPPDNHVRQLLPSLVLFAIAAYATLQCVPLPNSIVSLISPTNASSHVDWGGALLRSNSPEWIPISVAPLDSLHAAAWLTILAAVAFVVPTIYRNPRRSIWLLISVAFYGGVISAIGIARQWCPNFTLWSFHEGGEGSPFGTFFNRNNAALGINLGLASCVAIFLSRRHITTLNTAPRNVHPSRDKVRDPLAVASLAVATLCLCGLVYCGSRGGLIAMALSILVVAITFRSAIKPLTFPASIAFVGLIGMIAFDYFFSHDSLSSRWGLPTTSASITDRLNSDARLQHWPDAMRTAIAFFPFGSGVGTYGYAYLPWQESSSWRWFTHAENLWLEVIAETSVFGFLAILVCLWMLVNASRRLQTGASPLDQAYAATGVFLVPCLVVSQTLDFGLILPANSIVAVLLLTAVWSRSCPTILSHSKIDSQATRVIQSVTRWSCVAPRGVLATTAIIATVMIARTKLYHDGNSESAARTMNQALVEYPTDLSRLSQLSQQSKPLVDQSPTSELLKAYIDLEFQRGRLLELQMWGAGRLPKMRREMCYANTSQNYRRLAWRSDRSASVNVSRGGRAMEPLPALAPKSEAESAYRNAWRLTQQSLRHRPLAIEPRFHLVALEFVHRSPDQSKLALQQSAQLFKNTPELQLRAAMALANHGDYDQAIIAFRRALTLSPDRVGWVFGKAKRYANLPLDQIIPDDEQTRSAVEAYLQSRQLN